MLNFSKSQAGCEFLLALPVRSGCGVPGEAHPCRSPSARRRPWSQCCLSVSSQCPASPAASSGVAALAEAGLFGEWLFCHNLQVSASQRSSCWSPQADFKIGSDPASSSLALKYTNFPQKPFAVSLI